MRTLLLAGILICLFGCHFDGPFIESGKGLKGLIPPGKYTFQETPVKEGRNAEPVTVTNDGDQYLLDCKGDVVAVRIMDINGVHVAEVTDGNHDKKKDIVLVYLFQKTDVGHAFIPIDSDKWQKLLFGMKDKWKLATDKSPKILKDAPEKYVVSGDQKDKESVIKDVIVNHRDVFSADKGIEFKKVE